MKELEELGKFRTLEMIQWERRRESALDFKVLQFLQPAKPLRQLLILLLIKKEGRLSQARIAKEVGIVPAMVNNYIKEFRREGLLRIESESAHRPHYILTDAGQERIKELLFSYKNEIIKLYKGIRDDFFKAVENLHAEGVKRVVLFGAGDVAELIYPRLAEIGMEVVAVVDSDATKWGTFFFAHRVQEPEKIKEFGANVVLITSFAHKEQIKKELQELERNGIKIKTLH